ncbi:MAG: hypothetical protein F6K47_18615 [Symploca sp. SIO2E6]|nr:hypothetical protein [Symploca sp. SIO2E6]
MMKTYYLIIIGTFFISALAGASLATIWRHNLSQEKSPIEESPLETQSLPETKDHTSTVAATNPAQVKPNQATNEAKPSLEAQKEQLDQLLAQSLDLPDEVKPGSGFAQFRQRLRQAVQQRDVQFLTSILPPEQMEISGKVIPMASLNLKDTNNYFWGLLEKTLQVGCFPLTNEGHPQVDPNTGIWVCNNVAREFARRYPYPEKQLGSEYALDYVVVVGKNINLRSQPDTKSKVIDSVSNQVIKVNRRVLAQQAQKDGNLDPIRGWTPVILPDNQQGNVYNRFAYSPVANRAVFGKVNGKWQLLYMPGGS